MLEKLLHELGSFYSDLPVHDALFISSTRTLDLKDRMAVVPRYLEANGLDVTPHMIEKFSKLEDDEYALKIVEALRVILDEECEHVHKGDVWFKYTCDLERLPYEICFDIIEKHYPGSFPRKKKLNIKARQDAGFS